MDLTTRFDVQLKCMLLILVLQYLQSANKTTRKLKEGKKKSKTKTIKYETCAHNNQFTSDEGRRKTIKNV